MRSSPRCHADASTNEVNHCPIGRPLVRRDPRLRDRGGAGWSFRGPCGRRHPPRGEQRQRGNGPDDGLLDGDGRIATDETGTTSSTESEPTTSEAETPPPPPTPTDTTPADGSPGPDAHGGGSSSGHPHSDGGDSPVINQTNHSSRDPETQEGGVATIWLHRTLPDPTPPAKRLSPSFAALLRSAARAGGTRWWPILRGAVAHGHDGHTPAGGLKVERLAHRLANHALRLDAQERSLAHYNRAVGLRALVVGLEAAKPSLERRILRDSRIGLTAAGADDLLASRVDVRVLVVIRYLEVRFHQVTASSLVTGTGSSPGRASSPLTSTASPSTSQA